MKLKTKCSERLGFHVLLETDDAQAAVMNLQPGETSDDELSNEHPRCEQWLYVISGSGKVVTAAPGGAKRTVTLQTGSLVLIEKEEPHQIVNTGNNVMRTLNIYCPPAYTDAGEVRRTSRGKPARGR